MWGWVYTFGYFSCDLFGFGFRFSFWNGVVVKDKVSLAVVFVYTSHDKPEKNEVYEVFIFFCKIKCLFVSFFFW